MPITMQPVSYTHLDAWTQETEALLAAIPPEEFSLMLDRKIQYCWIYGYDLDCEDEIQNQISAGLKNSIETYKGQHPGTNGEVFEIYSGGVATARESFYTLYGGIFFLGIMLGIVFVFAAVLIVYYKQISEGYEDPVSYTHLDVYKRQGIKSGKCSSD